MQLFEFSITQRVLFKSPCLEQVGPQDHSPIFVYFTSLSIIQGNTFDVLRPLRTFWTLPLQLLYHIDFTVRYIYIYIHATQAFNSIKYLLTIILLTGIGSPSKTSTIIAKHNNFRHVVSCMQSTHKLFWKPCGLIRQSFRYRATRK